MHRCMDCERIESSLQLAGIDAANHCLYPASISLEMEAG